MATIQGTVTDSTGTGIENADVTITESGSNTVETETTTDANGDYSATVAADTYDVRATKFGFEPTEKTAIVVSSGETETVNLSTTRVDYKVRGQLTDIRGIGVLGRNKATSGQPVGVLGTIPNANDGYGIATTDDARIEGTIDTAETDFVVEAGTTATSDAQNVVHGHAANDTVGGTVGATIGGGGYDDGSTSRPNVVSANYGTIAGGRDNSASGKWAAVGGGDQNIASGEGAAVGGGATNTASGKWTAVGGGTFNSAREDGTTVGGGGGNAARGLGATVGGGQYNTATSGSEYATIAGGTSNAVSGIRATVGGGDSNTASGEEATVGGGNRNTASGGNATVGGGRGNTASSSDATVGGGSSNEANELRSTIGGGYNNRTGKSGTLKGAYATVPGGANNVAREKLSFAAGNQATAAATGAFVWGDSSSQGVKSTQADQFKIQAGGGAIIYSKSDLSTGVNLAPGDSTWSSLSSRAAKTDVSPVDPEAVLAGVESLEVSRWRYEGTEDIEHMGPMAGEFHAAFGLGADPDRIATIDADGVALAAIQGLSEKLEKRDQRIEDLEEAREELRRENEQLQDRLATVEDHLGLESGRDNALLADD